MKGYKIIYTLIIMAFVVSCAIISEPDLEVEEVMLLAPADCTKTSTRTHTLWWSTVDYAEKYNVQVVTPNFDYTERLIVDSNVVDNKYEVTLSPGKYQWSVMAYNASSASSYDIYNLEILSLIGLSGQIINLRTPASNAYLNNAQVFFSWQSLQGATDYWLKVKKGSWDTGDDIEGIPSVTDTTYTITLEEGQYAWGVRAYSDTSDSYTDWKLSAFLIDTTRPGIPDITNPANDYDTLKTSPYRVEWEHTLASLSAISDIVIISSDSLFEDGVLDSLAVTSTNYSLSDRDNGKYWVRLRSVDAAGNSSGYAERVLFLSKEDE